MRYVAHNCICLFYTCHVTQTVHRVVSAGIAGAGPLRVKLLKELPKRYAACAAC